MTDSTGFSLTNWYMGRPEGSRFKEATEDCDCGCVWFVVPDPQPRRAVATYACSAGRGQGCRLVSGSPLNDGI